jgi:hypothetical protein
MKYTSLLLVIFLVGCTTIGVRNYDGSSNDPLSIGVLYESSLTRVDSSPQQAGSRIVQLESETGKIIELKDRTELNPGKYIARVTWWRVIEDNSFFLVGPGALLYPIIDGNILRTPGFYEIPFDVHGGQTYVVDVESTLVYFKEYPKELCITEEPHNGTGAQGPVLNKSIRYPSVSASNASCGKYVPPKT